MKKEVIYQCIFDRKKRLYEIRQEIKRFNEVLEIFEFEEDMYCYLKDENRYKDEFSKKYRESINKFDKLSEELKILEKDEKILSLEIKYLEQFL